jgi:hypothetical protein
MFSSMSEKEKQNMKKIGIHFKCYQKNKKDLGVKLPNQNGPILELSAGTSEHEKSTGYSWLKIKEYLVAKL